MIQQEVWPFSTSFRPNSLTYYIRVPVVCVHAHMGQTPRPPSPWHWHSCSEAAAPGPAELRPGLSHLE